MASRPSTVALESGLDLRQVVTTGSILQINDVYDEEDCYAEPERPKQRDLNYIGKPVPNFAELEKTMRAVDENGYVKKKIIEEGGGFPLYDVNTVSVAFSGYWENDLEPFDSRNLHKPLVVDLKENGLLPGLQIAIKSMLVGETSLFLFSHEVMYGELGIPPRIKPKSKCAFYIKLIKSIITPEQGEIDFNESNIFHRVLSNARMLYSSGGTLYKTNNFPAAIQLFRRAVFILHKCRLANENEEKIQEKMLKKLYLNLAICYNKNRQPLKACTACNELNRLSSLWNNSKALFQNAKALRMIGEFDIAEKRLIRAIKLHSPTGDFNAKEDEAISKEIEALRNARRSCNQAKLVQKVARTRLDVVTEDFKAEVERLITNFKENPDLFKLIMPSGLNSSEVAYIKQTCIRENLFFNKVRKDFAALEDEENVTNVKNILNPEENFALDKYENEDTVTPTENESSPEEEQNFDEEYSGDDENEEVVTEEEDGTGEEVGTGDDKETGDEDQTGDEERSTDDQGADGDDEHNEESQEEEIREEEVTPEEEEHSGQQDVPSRQETSTDREDGTPQREFDSLESEDTSNKEEVYTPDRDEYAPRRREYEEQYEPDRREEEAYIPHSREEDGRPYLREQEEHIPPRQEYLPHRRDEREYIPNRRVNEEGYIPHRREPDERYLPQRREYEDRYIPQRRDYDERYIPQRREYEDRYIPQRREYNDRYPRRNEYYEGRDRPGNEDVNIIDREQYFRGYDPARRLEYYNHRGQHVREEHFREGLSRIREEYIMDGLASVTTEYYEWDTKVCFVEGRERRVNYRNGADDHNQRA